MDILHGKTLLRKSGSDFLEVRADDELSGVDVIGFYFSAHWCFPCLAFTPRLATCYKQLKEKHQAFEVVFVSADLSDEMMKSYMQESHGDWLAVPPGDDLTEELTEKYGVMGVPALVIAKKSGDIITMKGPRDVRIKGSDAFKAWKEGKCATTDEDEIEEAKIEDKTLAVAVGEPVAKKPEGTGIPKKKKKVKSKEEPQGTSHEQTVDKEVKKAKKTKAKPKAANDGGQSLEADSVATSADDEAPKVKRKKKKPQSPKDDADSGTPLEETGELPTCEKPVKKKIKRKKVKPEETAGAEKPDTVTASVEEKVQSGEGSTMESKQKVEKKRRKKVPSEDTSTTSGAMEEESRAESAAPKKKKIFKKKKVSHGDEEKVERIKEENEGDDDSTKTESSAQSDRLATQKRLEEELKKKEPTATAPHDSTTISVPVSKG